MNCSKTNDITSPEIETIYYENSKSDACSTSKRGFLNEIENSSNEYSFTLANQKFDVQFNNLCSDILQRLQFSRTGFLTIGYEDARTDGLTCIQTYIDEEDVGFNVEIVVKSNSKRGFTIYGKSDVPFEQTVDYFHTVLVLFEIPKLTDWKDITEEVKYYDASMLK